MVIVVVRWYIKNGQDEKFKATWEDMKPDSKEGLFREFFSKPIHSSEGEEKYHTLDFESKYYTTYINVGLWREIEDFDKAIGSKIPSRIKHPKKDNMELLEVYEFEFKLRERIVMNVEKIRDGEWVLPSSFM